MPFASDVMCVDYKSLPGDNLLHNSPNHAQADRVAKLQRKLHRMQHMGSSGSTRQQHAEAETMKWLQVDGGPKLVVPEIYARHWEGSGPPSMGRVVNAKFRWNDEGPATDYDRACDVPAWIGVIAVGSGHALVVGTESLTTGPIQSDETQLIEWFYGPDDAQVLEHFAATCRRNEFDTSIEFQHPGGRLILMSAADIVTDPVYEMLYFELPARKYLVRTKYVVDGEISYVAHRFT